MEAQPGCDLKSALVSHLKFNRQGRFRKPVREKRNVIERCEAPTFMFEDDRRLALPHDSP